MQRIVVLLALMAAVSAHAQPLAEHVPVDATVYIAWTGIDERGDAYGPSKLKAVLDATNMRQLLMETVPALMQDHADPDLLALYRELAPAAWHRPWAFYFAGVEAQGEDGPLPRFGLICRAGDYTDALEPQLRRLAERMNAEQDFGARVERRGDAVCLIAGSAGDVGLHGTERFAAATRRLAGAGDAFVAYLDVAGLMNTIDRVIEAEGEPADLARWHAARAELGLDGVEQLLTLGDFDGTGWRWDAYLAAPAPRRGIVAAVEGVPITDDDLKLIPKTATWVQVTNLDLAQLYNAVMNTLAAANPEAGDAARRSIAEANEAVGVDIPAMIRQLAPRWVMYSDAGIAGPMGLGVCIVNRPADPPRLEADLVAVERYLNGLLASEPDAPMQLQFKTIEQGDLTIHTLATPFVSPSWAVAGPRLHVSLFPQAVLMSETYARQEGTSILTNEKFTALRERIAAEGDAVAVAFIDLPQTAVTSYNSYMQLSQMLLSFLPPDAAEVAPGMLLPPLGLILPHLEPGGGVAWSAEDGLYARSYMPFPGASALSQNSMTFGGGGASMTAMGVGIMLPALGAARRTARQMQSNTQARGLHQSAIMWAQAHDEQFPDELFPLLEENFVTVDYAISPMSDVEAPPDFDAWPREQKRAWLRTHASYVLLPGKRATLDVDEIQLVGKPAHHDGGGIPVTWGDNHTTFETDIDAINRMLVEQTGKSLDQHVAESEAVE